MANDIAEFIVAKILVDSKTENPDAIAAAETLSYLRTGIGKISFTDGEIDEKLGMASVRVICGRRKLQCYSCGIPTQNARYHNSASDKRACRTSSWVCEPAHLQGKCLTEQAHLNQIKIPTTRVGK